MIYGDVADFISTIIDYDELNENFDLESIDDYLPEHNEYVLVKTTFCK